MRFNPTGTDMFFRTTYSRVTGIDIHIERFRDITRDKAALKKMNIVEFVNKSRHVVKITEFRIAILVGFNINYVYRCTCRSEIHAGTGYFNIMSGLSSIQHDFFRRVCNSVFNQ